MALFKKYNRIMIVEDDEDMRTLLCEFLEDSGYLVYDAGNGLSAMQIMRQHKPDIALLDVMLPDMDGYEICRWMKQEDSVKDTPVIFITARSALGDKLAGYVAGARCYLCKPFSLDDLLEQVSGVSRELEASAG